MQSWNVTDLQIAAEREVIETLNIRDVCNLLEFQAKQAMIKVLSNKTGSRRFERGKRKMRKESDLYKKIVYWSDEDSCFIGMCPELMYGGVHGSDALEVFKELNEAVEEVIEIYKEDGTPLPNPKEVVFEMV